VKSIITTALLALACNMCAAAGGAQVRFVDSFEVERMPFGSGTPAPAETVGTENADHVVDGLYHIPNYLPGFPTAATIWPREVPIECQADPATGRPVCGGYWVHPAVGRGEYIFIRPVVKPAPPPPPPPKLPKARKKPLE
jgi:hypothetical protein